MTDQTSATSDTDAGGLISKAGEKATEVGMQAYEKLPQKAQDTVLNSALKVQPAVSKVTPHLKKLVAGAGALWVIRKLRHRND